MISRLTYINYIVKPIWGESICRLSSKVFADFGGNYSTDLNSCTRQKSGLKKIQTPDELVPVMDTYDHKPVVPWFALTDLSYMKLSQSSKTDPSKWTESTATKTDQV